MKVSKHISFCTILLVMVSSIARGQSQPIKFKHLSFREGLAQSPISSIIKDSKGFVWLGNWKGLVRYDGYTFRTFEHIPNNHNSISHNRINSIIEDKQKQLWIGTSNGLNRYNPATEIFKRIDIKEEVKGGRNYIASVISDNYGEIWVATFAGVKLVDTTKWILKELPGLKDETSTSITSSVTFTLFEDANHKIWVGTKNGVKYFDPKTKKLAAIPTAILNCTELMDTKIIVIKQDKSGNLWFGSETNGLFRYDVKKNQVSTMKHQDGNPQSILSNWVRDIYAKDESNILIGTRNGLSIYNAHTQKYTNYAHNSLDPDGLNDNSIWSFMQDESDGIWIGTFSNGLNVYNPANANFSNVVERLGSSKVGLSHRLVNALIEDKEGSLWVGTSGLEHLDLKTSQNKLYEVKNESNQTRNGVKSFAKDDQGNLWMGTLDGLCYFNTTTKEIKFFNFKITQGKLSENLINAIATEKDAVWAGTNGGGLQHLKTDGTYVTYTHQPKDKTSISDNFVTALLKDTQQNMWVGTQNGLNYYQPKTDTFKKYSKSKAPYTLNNNSITTLLKDSKDRLWIGTEGGLNYYHTITNRFYALNEKAELTDNIIRSIIEDDHGDIWLSTDNGIYKLHFKTFELPFDAKDIVITHYDAKDGLASNQFSTNASLKLASGELIFGGINGLSSFYPDKISINKMKPRVAFTDFLIRNKNVAIDSSESPLRQSITFAKRIELNHNEGYITIKFAALNFINPEKNQYAYKMDGIRGDDWHYSGTQREANYTNLLPGRYTFMVKAANNDGIWNNEPISIQIIVLPPWWQTWWAFLIYAIVFYMVAKTIYDFVRNRTKLKRELYLEQLQNERQEELHQMKIDFFTNISHEIRTPLTLILGPLEKMVLNSGEHTIIYRQLLQVQNNANRLMRLVTELLDFRKAEDGHMKLAFSSCNIIHFTEEIYLSFQNLAQDKHIEYNFITEQEEVFVYFDKDHFEKVLFNLLSNAFKFTPAYGKITIEIKNNQDSVDIRITDNGKGIAPKDIDKLFNKFFQVYNAETDNNGYGIGLALSKSIVELHKGKIGVVSNMNDLQNRFTTFTVSLPTGSAHLDQSMLIPEFMNSDNPVHYYLQSQANTIITPEEDAVSEIKYTLLIIEDNQELRSFIRDSFQSQYHILEATNGAEGLTSAIVNMPDLIISDVMMPEMDGLELCRRVKSDEQINHIPVILLTARAAYIHQINGLEKGADAYITKPFSLQILMLNVKNLLNAREVLKQKYSLQILQPSSTLKTESPEEKFLQKLRQIILDKMGEPEFDVNFLVDEMGMSRTVLYKKVQALTNYAVADLIKKMRLKRAAELFVSTSYTVAEIAYMVGFNDRKYFSKEFKKEYQLTPSEYIAAHQLKD